MREIHAVVTGGGRTAGTVPCFAVDSPGWADVEQVNTHLERVLGVPTWVLRMIGSTGEGGLGGSVSYQVETCGTPDPYALEAAPPMEFPDTPLRMPWARPGGPATLLAWADGQVRRTGPAVQVRTWNLSCLLRLPTESGHVWVKALPPFAADEGAAIRLVSSRDVSLAPTLLATAPGVLLLGDEKGRDCWNPDPDLVASVVSRLVAVQAALAGPAALPVRPLQVTPDFGFPATLVHGDFHPGNWRSNGVVLDWADAHWGHPALDAARLMEFTDPSLHPLVERVWSESWLRHRPDCDPAAALRRARPIAHLLNALRYQEFLDNIEESERAYHDGDPEVERERARTLLGSAGPHPLPGAAKPVGGQ